MRPCRLELHSFYIVTMKQTIKYLAMLMVMLSFGLTSTSCSDDDDEGNGLSVDDYFMECVSATGGGWTSQELTNFQSNLNKTFSSSSYTWNGYTKEDAIEEFDYVMNSLYNQYYKSGLSDVREGSLNLTFALKMAQ